MKADLQILAVDAEGSKALDEMRERRYQQIETAQPLWLGGRAGDLTDDEALATQSIEQGERQRSEVLEIHDLGVELGHLGCDDLVAHTPRNTASRTHAGQRRRQPAPPTGGSALGGPAKLE